MASCGIVSSSTFADADAQIPIEPDEGSEPSHPSGSVWTNQVRKSSLTPSQTSLACGALRLGGLGAKAAVIYVTAPRRAREGRTERQARWPPSPRYAPGFK